MVTTEENLGRFSELEHSEDIDLTPRDSNILHAIQDEGLTVFAFDGLKRLLGVHQEMLSRVLDRLEDEGLLEKVSEGYRLTTRGNQPIARPLNSIQPRIPIVQSLLPHDVDVQRIIAGLKGRWFGSLRWLGYSFFFSSRRRHTIFDCDWSSDVCSSDLRVSDSRSTSPMRAWCSIISTYPASPCSASARNSFRPMNRRDHWTDVVYGSRIGPTVFPGM